MIYDMETRGVARSFQPHSQAVSCLAWSRDGHFLASAGLDSTLSLWRVLDNQQVGSGPCATIQILHACLPCAACIMPAHALLRHEPS